MLNWLNDIFSIYELIKEQWAINNNKFLNLKEMFCFKLKKAMKESMAVMSYLLKEMKTLIILLVIRPFYTWERP